MQRRAFVALLGAGAATAWSALVRAQPVAPPPAAAPPPLIGFLNAASPATYRFNADAFREGLAQAGFVEDRNVRIEERWANGDYRALPMLAQELVDKGAVAIAATGDIASARAARGPRRFPSSSRLAGTRFASAWCRASTVRAAT